MKIIQIVLIYCSLSIYANPNKKSIKTNEKVKPVNHRFYQYKQDKQLKKVDILARFASLQNCLIKKTILIHNHDETKHDDYTIQDPENASEEENEECLRFAEYRKICNKNDQIFKRLFKLNIDTLIGEKYDQVLGYITCYERQKCKYENIDLCYQIKGKEFRFGLFPNVNKIK